MNILVNCTNLKIGGGVQVGDSICCLLKNFKEHRFHVVLSNPMSVTKGKIKDSPNVVVYTYNIKNSLNTLLWGRDCFLDSIVEQNNIDAVLTVFGPSRWNPKVPHLSGFARPHLVLTDSPYFKRMPFLQRIKSCIGNMVLKYYFDRSSNNFWTENEFISRRLRNILTDKKKVFTVTNYYNQVFDNLALQDKPSLIDNFDGVTCLSISSYKDFKNFEILPQTAKILKVTHPEFKFRFVLTLKEDQLTIENDLSNNFVFLGNIDVSECPSLYRDSTMMVLPTLMECFTATYPEAMRMEVPVVTSDLEFARGLCGDAACYFDPLNPVSIAESIYKVATDKEYAQILIENGKRQLLNYDTYEQRAAKLIRILEGIVG